jgi:hypothetical protein
MKEYAVMAETVTLKPEAYSATASQLAQLVTTSVNRIVVKASKGLPKFQGGGWDIVSYNLTRLGDHLVVSFLISR